MKFLLIAAFLSMGSFSYAETQRENSLALRQLIKASKSQKSEGAETIKLPVSRGFDQKDTSLCWVYSFLNAQETLYRVKNPGSDLELSRAAFQYRTMEDRLLRHARRNDDTPNMIKESGTPLDAWSLGKKGMVAFKDYRDIRPEWMVPKYQVVAIAVEGAETQRDQEVVLTAELEKLFGVFPTQTHLGAKEVTPQELAQEVFGEQDWISYSPGTLEDFGPHADTDARPGVQSFYTSLDNIKNHVYRSLKAGHPVNYTANGHVVLIYGGVYDSRGKALRFFIKDSYSPYFYESDANKVFKNLLEVTMLK